MRTHYADGSWDEEIGDQVYHYDRHGRLVGKTEHNANERDYEFDRHLKQVGWTDD